MAAANETQIEERRSNPRAPIRTHVDFFADEELQVGESLDLGGGGMLLASSLPLEVGAELRLRFTPPSGDRSIFMGGRVARVAGRGAFGIEFVEPELESVDELDRLALEFIERMRALDPTAPPHPEPTVLPDDETHLDLRAAPDRTEDTLYFTLTFESREDFLEAYAEHLSLGRVLVASPDPLDLGWPIVIELELPEGEDLLALRGEVAEMSLAGEWAHEDLTVVRLTEIDSAEMRRVRDYASQHGDAEAVAAPVADAPSSVEADDFEDIEVLVEDDDFAEDYEAEFSADDFEGGGAPIELASEEDALDSVISSALSKKDGGTELTWSEEQAETEREVEAALRASTVPAPPPPRTPAKSGDDGRYFGDALVADLMADEGLSGDGARFEAPTPIEEDAAEVGGLRATKRNRNARSLSEEEVLRLRSDLEAEDPELRRAALQELGNASNPPDDILPLLTAALDDPDSRVRWRAVRALRAMGPAAAGAADALERIREDSDPGVRFMVVEALSALAG